MLCQLYLNYIEVGDKKTTHTHTKDSGPSVETKKVRNKGK